MELSHDQFTDITGVTDQSPVYDADDDRREHSRVAFGSRARIYPLVAAICPDGRSVLVRDISPGGVGLLFSDPLAAGDELLIRLPRRGGDDLVIHCMVQRCEAGGSHGKQFVIGATFEQVLDESVLIDDSMVDSPLVRSAMANLPPVWRSRETATNPVGRGSIRQAVALVWKRLAGLFLAEAVEETPRECAPPVVKARPAMEPISPALAATTAAVAAVALSPARTSLFATADIARALPPVALPPVALPPVATPLPVAVEPLPSAPDTAPATEPAAIAMPFFSITEMMVPTVVLSLVNEPLVAPPAPIVIDQLAEPEAVEVAPIHPKPFETARPAQRPPITLSAYHRDLARHPRRRPRK